MSITMVPLGTLVRIRTGKLDANASSKDGKYPFFTCAIEPLRIDSYSYDCECVLVAGNGDLNAKYYNGKFDAYQRTYIIESLDSSKLYTRYLFHFMDRYVAKLRQMSIGGVIKYIKLGYLTEAQIPLPPLPEQKRIAAILDKVDAIRRKREKAIELTDSFLRSVFLEMFGDPVSNPKGFQIIKIGELLLANPNNGVFRKNDDYDGAGLPVAWVKELFDGYSLDLTKSRRLTPTPQEMERYSLSNGDVLFCRSSLKREGTGYSNVFLGEDRTALFECHLIRIRPNPSMIDSSFFNFQLRLPSMRQRMLSRCNTVTMSTIGQNVILDLLVMVPPLKLQRQFSALLVKTCALHKKMDSTVGIITQLAGSLSNKLFTTRSIPITAVDLQEAHAL